jgi:hypothetical protein
MRGRLLVTTASALLALAGCSSKRDLGNLADGGAGTPGTAGTGGGAGQAGTGGGTAGAGGTSERVCTPGMSIACVCTNGAMGAQVCAPDGTTYQACICDGPGTAGTTGGSGGAGGSAGSGGRAGTGGSAAGGTGGMSKSCLAWTTAAFANFDDGQLDGLSNCFGCSGGVCPSVIGQQLYMPSQWNLICYPGLTASETRAIRISYDVTDKGTMGGMGWDNFAANLKTGTGSATCGDSINPTHSVIYAVPAPSLVGHWELIRWGGNSFQFNHDGAVLGEIDCALPALSGMAVDFHEGGPPGWAQSKIDNFRVEICTSSP